MKYSIIIPVYNRPDEVQELLDSLTRQTYKSFEVIIVEDGSTNKCETVVDNFVDVLDVQYYFKKNAGQGFARNYGYDRAKGDYFISFDSDCIIPEKYMEIVDHRLSENFLDAFGGPDKAADSFTNLQKAISYAMTSPMSTGGIRGSKKRMGGAFQPRGFNMGISREAYEKTGGFKLPNMGEDIELSLRLIDGGFSTGLIPEAFVYHKRRASFKQFYKQIFSFGRSRLKNKQQIKLVHLFPTMFALAVLLIPVVPLISSSLSILQVSVLSLYSLIVFSDAATKHQNTMVGFLSVRAVWTQLMAYGLGFIAEFFTSRPPQKKRKPKATK